MEARQDKSLSNSLKLYQAIPLKSNQSLLRSSVPLLQDQRIIGELPSWNILQIQLPIIQNEPLSALHILSCPSSCDRKRALLFQVNS
ncbi:hypothetical protein FGO68_gene12360 [Halteria grandinella]|uniref:Uncharacterized protein n=1 Tax=Halteria grandinella TaxID=5974 RepID=A0A8J8NWB5_HALGN|nr:hypothetical protein FGO68_gene12360 [Halteria grandinella]